MHRNLTSTLNTVAGGFVLDSLVPMDVQGKDAMYRNKVTAV